MARRRRARRDHHRRRGAGARRRRSALHDLAAAARGPLTTAGIRALPASSLAARAVAFLEAGPVDSATLAREVLGVARGGRKIAERLAVTMFGADPRVAREPDGRWRLAGEAGAVGSPALAACRFAVVDVETTGAPPTTGGRMIEIAVAVLDADRVSLIYQSLVNPGVSLSPIVASITGIHDADLETAPAFSGVADDVLAALAGSVFVAHNVAHDWSFVSAELVRARDVMLVGPRLCTVRLARRLLPSMESRSLDAVTESLGIEIARRHRAADDAVATAEVLRRLLVLARERGVRTLAELQQLKKPKAA